MTVLELKERAVQEAELAREIKDKADEESRGMTQDEAEKFDTHLAESQRLEIEATRQERLESTEARLNQPQPKKVQPEPANGERIEVVKPDLFRSGKLQAFKRDVDAYTTGKFLLATLMNNAPARQWCRDKGVEMRVQTEGINTAGGFVVPDVMERAIIDLRETYGMYRANARVIPMSSDHTVIPRRTGGVTAAFIGETTEITASDKSWNQVELTAKKLGALTRMSTDLSEDAIINLADDLAQEMAYAFAKKEDECGIDGDGTSTYGGMVGIKTKMIDGSHAGSYVEATASGDAWSEISETEVIAMIAALPKYARPNAKWYIDPVGKAALFDRMLAAAGGNTIQSLQGKIEPNYLGYPIVEAPAMSYTEGTDAVIMFFFGDLSMAATFGNRRGITIKVSTDRYIEYDQIGIQATERFCIVNHDIGGAATVRGAVVGCLANA